MEISEQKSFQDLREIIATRSRQIVLWIGAGLSREAGIPGWIGLRNKLCEELEKDIIYREGAHADIDYHRLGLLQKAKNHDNLWMSFQLLKQAIGETSYVEIIRDIFSKGDTCDIPSIYNLMWKLPIQGVLNLNLDKLATRSFVKNFNDKIITEFDGKSSGDYIYMLKGKTPFLAYLHGNYQATRSWVLTNTELVTLFNVEGYRQLINSCLCNSTIIFMGITPEDVAVGGHLERLKNSKIDFGSHFWVTHRIDETTREWAENISLRMVLYDDPNKDHSGLTDLISKINDYFPVDETPPPVTPPDDLSCDIELPSPLDILKLSDEEIRVLLNREAKRIIGTANFEEEFEDFCNKYDRAIYQSWYVSKIPPHNIIFNYLILDEIAQGAFGRVFKAEDRNGNIVAVKILREEVRRKSDWLKSFRRGVNSMKLLSDHNIDGMVPYKFASEIPAMTVMDYIEGPNLADAVESKFLSDWQLVIQIASDLAKIINSAHCVPERVLHRDIRPPNIMLKNFYNDFSNFEVVVLDFDLSWHMGADECSVSITNESGMAGYLAPEQIEKKSKFSSKNTLVDSYCLGMTLYFLRTGINPVVLQHRQKDWSENMKSNVCAYNCSKWKSLPMRYARIIDLCTQNNQSSRLDISQIQYELDILHQVLLSPEDMESVELLTEEVLARVIDKIDTSREYIWKANKSTGYISLFSGLEARFRGLESSAQRI